jgi:hypothetical protein
MLRVLLSVLSWSVDASDMPARVNDVGLCDDCNAKPERALIRARDWEYSATAFLTPEHQRKTPRLDICRAGNHTT